MQHVQQRSHLLQLSSVDRPRGTPSAPTQPSLGHSTYWVPAHLPGSQWGHPGYLLEKSHPRPVLLALVSDRHSGPWMNSRPQHEWERRGETPKFTSQPGPPQPGRGPGRAESGARRAQDAARRPSTLPRTRRHAKQLEFAPTNQRAAPRAH